MKYKIGDKVRLTNDAQALHVLGIDSPYAEDLAGTVRKIIGISEFGKGWHVGPGGWFVDGSVIDGLMPDKFEPGMKVRFRSDLNLNCSYGCHVFVSDMADYTKEDQVVESCIDSFSSFTIVSDHYDYYWTPEMVWCVLPEEEDADKVEDEPEIKVPKYHPGDKVRVCDMEYAKEKQLDLDSSDKELINVYAGQVVTICSAGADDEGFYYCILEDEQENTWDESLFLGIVTEVEEKFVKEDAAMTKRKIILEQDGEHLLYQYIRNGDVVLARSIPCPDKWLDRVASDTCALILQRIREEQNFTCRVVCTESGVEKWYTVGKIYEIDHGTFTRDDGSLIVGLTDFDHFTREASCGEWLKIVE